jgi:hypothetical protein
LRSSKLLFGHLEMQGEIWKNWPKSFWIEPDKEEDGQQQYARIVLVITIIIIISIRNKGHKIT